MKKRVVSVLLVVMFTASIFAFAGCSTSGGSADVVKLGFIGPMTGDAAIYGSSAEEGAQLAVAEINAAGGIDGKNIELVAYDSKADQTEAINAYNRLRDQDGVVAVIGGTLSGETLAMKDIMVQDNMPVLSPTATAVEVTQAAPNVFRACFLDDYQGQAAANFAATTLGAKTAALLIGTGNPYSEGVSEAFKAAFTAKGGTIAGSESYGTADKDFSAQLTKIKEMNPDVVFVPDYVQTVGPILQKAKEMGITAKFVGADGWDGVQEEYADAAQGNYFTNHYAADSPSETVQNFITAYKKEYDKVPNSFAALGYDAVYAMVEAITAAGSTDSADIITALKATDHAGVTGTLKFDEEGNPKDKEVTIIKIDGGQLKFDSTVVNK
ncbi:ABC transporter substrate-binding protein [Acetobacterium sp.]|jgi:branched-chain amino acid transport system substrate-binding protein|uniref:ABC transporter substrate-binding protein n=1 Tax=Acetobacterium sp. TaxID=1872094 RepID=UPI002726BBBB|nr:ABC transporter substrate-binding protein [Acetobacterium sp.]MDO9493504.1 ABC transporter substrate-binding protein [Acetobacterium sp.]